MRLAVLIPAVWYLSRLRLDGFASVHAGEKHGTVLTKPVTITGATLTVNVAAARGALRAELIDAGTERVIDGYGTDDCLPVCETAVSVPLRWREHETIEPLRNRTVQIRFRFRDLDLYAFWFEER